MKLGFLLFDYFPFGGLQRDCLSIARRCATRGAEVTLLTRTWSGPPPDDLKVRLFGRHGWSNVSRNRHWIRQLAEELPRLALDGVIGFNKLPGLDLYFGSDPCFVAKQQRLRPFWYRWSPRFRHFRELEESVFRADGRTQILLLTDQEIPTYQKFYGTPRERFHLLPPGISRIPFREQDRVEARLRMRKELGVPPEARLLVLVGSGFRVKGLDRAIRAMAALPEDVRSATHLAVIGQNRKEPFSWQAARAGLGSQVHFLGGRNDVRDWLLAADVLVHPAYSESAGMVLLEAMTVGLPVLATDTCGYAFHIRDARAGVIVASPFTDVSCARALNDLLTSSERAAWSKGGLAYAASHDLYSCHERAVEIIFETVSGKAAR